MLDVTIVVKRHAYWIPEYELGSSPRLEKRLSVWNYLDKVVSHIGYHYDEESSTLKMPSGIDLDIVVSDLAADGFNIKELVNETEEWIKYRTLDNITLMVKPRDNFQIESVSFMQANGVDDSKSKRRLLRLGTGFGKTICTIMATSHMKVPTLVVSVSLSSQWLKRADQFTDGEIGEELIHIKNVDQMLSMQKKGKHKNAAYYVIGLDALVASLRRGEDKINKFIKRMGIGCVVFDEAHEHFMKIIKCQVNMDVYRIFYLTATPSRSSKLENRLYQLLFLKNIDSYGHETKELTKYNVIMLRYHTEVPKNILWKVDGRRGVSGNMHALHILNDAEYVSYYVNIVKAFVRRHYALRNGNPNMRILVYLQSCRLIKVMNKRLTEEVGAICGYTPTYGDYTTNKKKGAERDKELKHNVIFTTLAQKLGLDVPGLNMIINFCAVSSEEVVDQLRGRMREEDGWLVDTYDSGVKGMLGQKAKRESSHAKVARKLMYYRYDPLQGIVKENNSNELNKRF